MAQAEEDEEEDEVGSGVGGCVCVSVHVVYVCSGWSAARCPRARFMMGPTSTTTITPQYTRAHQHPHPPHPPPPQSSEYTTESEEEDEGPGGRRLIKPVFVPKGDREVRGARAATRRRQGAGTRLRGPFGGAPHAPGRSGGVWALHAPRSPARAAC